MTLQYNTLEDYKPQWIWPGLKISLGGEDFQPPHLSTPVHTHESICGLWLKIIFTPESTPVSMLIEWLQVIIAYILDFIKEFETGKILKTIMK